MAIKNINFNHEHIYVKDLTSGRQIYKCKYGHKYFGMELVTNCEAKYGYINLTIFSLETPHRCEAKFYKHGSLYTNFIDKQLISNIDKILDFTHEYFFNGYSDYVTAKGGAL